MGVGNLSTSRVLIVDDKPDEAVPIMTALGKIGVGCIYVKGDKEEELPSEPVEGIRLVFLDMRLDEGGPQRSVLSKTVGVLKRCVPERTTPLVIVCWTKHEDDVEVFKEMVVKDIPGLKTGFIVGMPKPAKGTPGEWKGILGRIRKTLAEYDAVGLVWHWEKVIHMAATETSQTLAEVSSQMLEFEGLAANGWQDKMLALCRELVRAEAGKTVDKKTASNALFRMLNELAVDAIQHSALREPVDCAEKLVPGQDSTINVEHTCRLNQMLLMEPVSSDDRSCAPGSLVVGSNSRASKEFLGQLGLKKTELVRDLVDVSGHEDWKNLNKQAVKLKQRLGNAQADDPDHEELKNIEAQMRRVAGNVSRQCRALLIEVSASCDYAQGKRPVARFIAGLAVPLALEKCLRKGDYIFRLDAASIPSLEGTWRLVLSSRHTFSAAATTRACFPPASCRLRSHALAELRAWAAFRNARPGMISMR